MDYIAALKEMYFEDWTNISASLGTAICSDDVAKTKEIIRKYFSTPEARPLFDGPVAYQSPLKNGDEGFIVTPVFLAVDTSNRKALETILEFTQDPDARDVPENPSAFTLLMVAAQRGDIQTVKFLLDQGANPNDARESDGDTTTALSAAAIGNFHQTVELLIERGAKPLYCDAMFSIRDGKSLPPILLRYLKEDPSLIQQKGGKLGNTLLHRACTFGNLASVEWLLSNGADINAEDNCGETPLDYARLNEEEKVAEYLKANGGVTKPIPTEIQSERESIEPKKSEITEIVERLELLEEKLGISLNGLYASIEPRAWASPPDFGLCINFDVLSTGGESLSESFYIRATAYNEAGQVVGKDDVFIHNVDFSGFDSKSINMVAAQRPVKIRLFPAK